MARPKKNQELKESLEETQPILVDIQPANDSQKSRLEIKLAYLRDLRDKFGAEGVNSIGTLDVLISKVIQELTTL